MASGVLAEFTDDNFEAEVLKSSLPVLVDFWAQWCGPCKMLTPIVEELAKDFDGRLKIGKLNVDDSPQFASRYSVNSIPTLLFIKDGNVVDQHVGLLAKKALQAKIEQFLK
jgi:thioredoxin 1